MDVNSPDESSERRHPEMWVRGVEYADQAGVEHLGDLAQKCAQALR